MRKYYYSVGIGRKGPLTLEELKSSGELTPATLVWYEGLPSWVRADALPELSGMFAPSPVTYVGGSAAPIVINQTNTSTSEGCFLMTGKGCLIAVIVFIVLAIIGSLLD